MATTLPIVLITCASGATGKELVKELSATNKFTVRAGVRDTEKAKKTFNGLQNVEIVKLDETDATSKEAFSGIYGLYLIIPEPHPKDPCFPMWIKHAKESKNLKHFVFHSNVSANEGDPVELNRVTYEQQEAIRKSGIPYTFLRPTFFNQNVEKFMLETLGKGYFIGASNNGPYTTVDVRDIASVAVKVFLEYDSHFGKSYPLTSEVITDEEQAKILSDKLGRTIKYENLSPEKYTAELEKAGIAAPTIKAIIELEKEKSDGTSIPVKPDLAQLLGRPGITLAQYIQDITPTLKKCN